MREIRPPAVEGQTLVVEDRGGERWRVGCLGEPVEVGARILFLPLPPEGAQLGEMVRLLEAPRREWVCTLRRGASGWTLTLFGDTESQTLRLNKENAKGAEDGSRVVVVADGSVGRSGRKPRLSPAKASRGRPGSARGHAATISVRVVEVLGKPLDPESDHRALVWKHRLTTRFSRRVRLEVQDISGLLSKSELARRVDLRHLPFVTIDPASARDHDDAVFAERRVQSPLAIVDQAGKRRPRESGASAATWSHRVWIAISDVSHFVTEKGWIDAEARRRGNSFYFPDRAIPMLPERLSSDLCSLRPEVDRLAMVVELRLTGDGRVADALFHEAVVRSRVGLSYEDAARWLSSEPAEIPAEASEWGASLRCLDEIARAFSKARRKAGAIDLELPEIEIQLDEAGRAIDAKVRERNRAHRLIEEVMLAANRAVARALDSAACETIHRVHPAPSGSKLVALAGLLERLGVEVRGDLAEPGVLAKLLEEVKGGPFEERIHTAALRSLSQARYEAVSRGHYALRFEHYVHFTSPIRRYADLDVHRALKKLIRGESTRESGGERASKSSARLAIWLSGRERVAVEVERDAEAMAACAIMSGREGERFWARVMAATEYGLFVRLESPAVRGLVPMRALDGHWIHDPDQEALLGERSGTRIGLGDRIAVRLLEVDVNRGRIAFRMASSPGRSRGRR